MGKEITARQQRVLDCVRDFTAAKGYPPTLREIGAILSIRSTNGVTEHLVRLERKGYMRAILGAP